MTESNEVDELKRRVAELEGKKSPPHGRTGCATYIGLGLVGLIAIYMIAQLGPTETPKPTSATQPTPASAPTCNMAWSNKTIETARTTPLVRDMAVRKDGLHIVVGVPQWSYLTLNQRDQVISAADCSIAGPGYLKAIVVESPSGSVLKNYSYLDLYEARKLQGRL